MEYCTRTGITKPRKSPGLPWLPSACWIQVRERICYLHYSLKTEAYLYWVRFFVLWSARQGVCAIPKKWALPMWKHS